MQNVIYTIRVTNNDFQPNRDIVPNCYNVMFKLWNATLCKKPSLPSPLNVRLRNNGKAHLITVYALLNRIHRKLVKNQKSFKECRPLYTV